MISFDMTVRSGSFWFVVVTSLSVFLTTRSQLYINAAYQCVEYVKMGWQVVGSCLFFWLADHSIQAIIIIHLGVCDICVISTTGLLCGVFDS